jgi:hypothetical protein
MCEAEVAIIATPEVGDRAAAYGAPAVWPISEAWKPKGFRSLGR